MQCRACTKELPAGLKFCPHCGAELLKVCGKCGLDQPCDFNFCGHCGASLSEPSRPSDDRKAGDSREEFAAERRQLTVMFCDLVESTRLSAYIDPEELRDVIRSYQRAVVEVVERLEGHVAQYLGDGLLVYFGFPSAHEDDARRAVLAGLGICETVAKLAPVLPGELRAGLAVRVGIHTGPAVTGAIGAGQRQEQLALGQTPNIAARLQALAAPDTVVLGAATYDLVRSFFAWEPLGLQALKGISEPMELYRPLHASDVLDRFEAGVDRGLFPLVGRERDLALLHDRFEQAAAGRGQAVMLYGEAGIGKSRLRHEFRQRIGSRAEICRVCHCSAYSQASAFRPLIELIEESCQIERGAPPLQSLSRLEAFLKPYALPLDEAVPLLATLLSIPLEGRYEPSAEAPQVQKERTLEILLRILLHPPSGGLAVFMVEDLHWADPSTLEFLDRLISRAGGSPLFIFLTARPEFTYKWAANARLTSLPLERLGDELVEQMIVGVAGGKALPVEAIRQLTQRADGIPLFVEELTKMVLESGQLEETGDGYRMSQALPTLDIPVTLQDSLTARLDRLSTVKLVAQLGAVLGREFSYAMLRMVSPLDEASLRRGLDHLVQAEFLFERGVPPHTTYTFKHSLIQNAACASLLKSTRQQYHRRFAETLEAQFPDRAEAQPELLAYHFTEANLTGPALAYWFKAARRAISRSSNLEAIDHCRQGLKILRDLPAAPGRDEQELDLLTMLASALQVIKTYASPEVEQTYTRARELCLSMERTPKLFLTYWGLYSYYLVRAHLDRAIELGEQLLRLGESSADAEILLTGHVALGTAYYYSADFDLAQEHLDRMLALRSARRDRSPTFATGQDVGVVGRTFCAWVAWARGYPDQALAHAEEAIAMARELAHPFSLAFALHSACCVRMFRDEPLAIKEWLGELLPLAREKGFMWWYTTGSIRQALVELAEAEDKDAGLERVLHCIDALTATGGMVGLTQFMALLAQSAIQYGRLPQARHALERGRAALRVCSGEVGELQYEAEICRLEGEVELAAVREEGAPVEAHQSRAEERFMAALAAARRRGAKSLELRAALSLSRLWQSQGKRTDAQALLRPVYAGFTEGFTAPDLCAARALLADLE